MQQKILSGKELGAGRFLTLVELEFQDDRGRIRHWESVDRRGGTGAAFIIARIVPDDEILLVRTEQGVAFSQDWYLEDFGDGGEI